ncbi:unnamed protein product [Vitrella brassicaformis CCMP3155]|uniref:Uncharacterized protein n=2 Tax=Vitrella brassicaformis TaxID=1169539 RepID=A0A0G4FSW0_VITBC|nr:unnamed protein product [Vitrella brassicaformis CCMP3155]|eukprot:CEM17546.1 unnamed protein product [Vitrella brassicaformis CCMP3155]
MQAATGQQDHGGSMNVVDDGAFEQVYGEVRECFETDRMCRAFCKTVIQMGFVRGERLGKICHLIETNSGCFQVVGASGSGKSSHVRALLRNLAPWPVVYVDLGRCGDSPKATRLKLLTGLQRYLSRNNPMRKRKITSASTHHRKFPKTFSSLLSSLYAEKAKRAILVFDGAHVLPSHDYQLWWTLRQQHRLYHSPKCVAVFVSKRPLDVPREMEGDHPMPLVEFTPYTTDEYRSILRSSYDRIGVAAIRQSGYWGLQQQQQQREGGGVDASAEVVVDMEIDDGGDKVDVDMMDAETHGAAAAAASSASANDIGQWLHTHRGVLLRWWNRFIDVVLNVESSSMGSDFKQMQDIARILWPRYIAKFLIDKRVSDAGVSTVAMTKQLRDDLAKIRYHLHMPDAYFRSHPPAALAHLTTDTPHTTSSITLKKWSLLPVASKLLLVSSFVAGYNTPTNDWRLMRPDSAGTSRGREQNQKHRRQIKAQKQLMDEMDTQEHLYTRAPQLFDVPRLLAIAEAIRTGVLDKKDNLERHMTLHQHVVQLVRLGWLVLCKDRDGVPDELGGRRQRCQYRTPRSAASAHSNRDLGRQLLDNKAKMLTNVRYTQALELARDLNIRLCEINYIKKRD